MPSTRTPFIVNALPTPLLTPFAFVAKMFLTVLAAMPALVATALSAALAAACVASAFATPPATLPSACLLVASVFAPSSTKTPPFSVALVVAGALTGARTLLETRSVAVAAVFVLFAAAAAASRSAVGTLLESGSSPLPFLNAAALSASNSGGASAIAAFPIRRQQHRQRTQSQYRLLLQLFILENDPVERLGDKKFLEESGWRGLENARVEVRPHEPEQEDGENE
mmetsp:Transcript_65218/g.141548  ORF Transcript_65218/g.141548 Transcript_65218/m.141548 type:complete len:226 (+) Transcript_65218:1562-2239(+)